MVAMVRWIAWLFLVLGTTFAAAHDHWINHLRLTDPLSGQWCCNDMDCEAVRAAGIAEQQDGYLVMETGEVIGKERVIWKSQDGLWWRCRYTNGSNAGRTRCLIGPPPNS
jgi:hypothetical protein